MSTAGTDLMRSIHSGEMAETSLKVIDQFRGKVSEAIVELLTVGARVRPLILDGVDGALQVGWVRGVFPSERKRLLTWFKSPEDQITEILKLGTSLNYDEIEGLRLHETLRLMAIIDKLTQADMSLYPYLGAFCTTSASEMVWHGHRTQVVNAEPRTIELNERYKMRLLTASNHALLWASLAEIREKAKEHLEAATNTSTIARALVGKGADRMAFALQKQRKLLLTDHPDPWKKIVNLTGLIPVKQDGWGHTGEDDSTEAVMRELHGMLKEDKHEQFMDRFYAQQLEGMKREVAPIYEPLDAMVGFEPSEMTDNEMADWEKDRIGAAAEIAKDVQDAMEGSAKESSNRVERHLHTH